MTPQMSGFTKIRYLHITIFQCFIGHVQARPKKLKKTANKPSTWPEIGLVLKEKGKKRPKRGKKA